MIPPAGPVCTEVLAPHDCRDLFLGANSAHSARKCLDRSRGAGDEIEGAQRERVQRGVGSVSLCALTTITADGSAPRSALIASMPAIPRFQIQRNYIRMNSAIFFCPEFRPWPCRPPNPGRLANCGISLRMIAESSITRTGRVRYASILSLAIAKIRDHGGNVQDQHDTAIPKKSKRHSQFRGH